MRRTILFLAITWAFVSNVSAQNNSPISILGNICEKNNHYAVPYANISILAKNDSTLLTGTTTDASGQFILHLDSIGDYFIQVSSIGYEKYFQNVSIMSDSTKLQIEISKESTQLNEVLIVAEKPLYSTEGESEIYHISNDASVQTLSLDKAMSNIPGIEVDAKGQVTYRGQYSVEIMKNGQPMNLSGENLIMYLKSIPSSMVERIEVIDNPSARYLSNRVILNIISKKTFANNNFIMLGGSADSSPEIIPWASYVFSNEKITANVYANFGYDGKNLVSNSQNRLFLDNHLSRTESINGETLGGQKGTVIAANIAYQIDTTSAVSFFGELSRMQEYLASISTHERQEYIFNAGNYDFVHTDTSNRDGRMMAIGLMYNKAFPKSGQELNIIAHIQDYKSDLSNNSSRNFSSNSSDFYGHYDYEVIKRILNTEASYSIPYSAMGKLEFGLNAKYYQFDKDRSAILFQSHDAIRSYVENMSTLTYGSFITAMHSFGRISAKVGMRLNLNQLKSNQLMPMIDSNNYTFWEFSPSVHLTYLTRNRHAFKVNYTFRTSAPSIDQLSNIKKYDYDSYEVGNPSLDPSYSHHFQAGWNKYFPSLGRIAVTGYWRSNVNDISGISHAGFDSILGTVVGYSSFQNIGNSSAYGIETNILCRIAPFFQAQIYYNGYNYHYSTQVLDQGMFEDHAFCNSIRVHASANPTQWLTIYVNGNYVSSTLALQLRNKSYSSIDLGISAELCKQRLLAYLSVEDIFNQNSQTTNIINPYFLSYSYIKHPTRFIMAGITYRFGQIALKDIARTGDKFMKDKQ